MLFLTERIRPTAPSMQRVCRAVADARARTELLLVAWTPRLIHAAANFASFFAFRGLSIKERTFCFIVWK